MNPVDDDDDDDEFILGSVSRMAECRQVTLG
jgi:hypothetical protein